MKNIGIIYENNSGEGLTPPQCRDMLTLAGYGVTLYPIGKDFNFRKYFSQWGQSGTDLFLTYNLAGLSCRTTSGSCSYNLLPQNILHYVQDLSQTNHRLLEGVHNLSTALLVTSQRDAQYARIFYPGICRIIQIESLEKNLIPLLSDLDWRRITKASVYASKS